MSFSLLFQGLGTLFFFVVLTIFNSVFSGLSWSAGGGAVMFSSLVFGLFFAFKKTPDSKTFLKNLFRAEALKLTVAGVLIIFIFRSGVIPVFAFGGFVLNVILQGVSTVFYKEGGSRVGS